MVGRYHVKSLNLTEHHRKRLRRGETIQLSPEHMRAGKHHVHLTEQQIKRMEKAIAEGRGMRIKMSRTQHEHNRRHGGGFWDTAVGKTVRNGLGKVVRSFSEPDTANDLVDSVRGHYAKGKEHLKTGVTKGREHLRNGIYHVKDTIKSLHNSGKDAVDAGLRKASIRPPKYDYRDNYPPPAYENPPAYTPREVAQHSVNELERQEHEKGRGFKPASVIEATTVTKRIVPIIKHLRHRIGVQKAAAIGGMAYRARKKDGKSFKHHLRMHVARHLKSGSFML